MFRKIAVLYCLCCGIFCIAGCEQERPLKVSLEKRVVLEKEAIFPSSKALRFAIGGMVVPRQGFNYYIDFLNYVERKTGLKFSVFGEDSYAKVNQLLRSGDVDAAFVCSGPYVDGKKEFGLELIAMPVVYGEPVYYSYVIVAADSPIKDLNGLRGKVFAFTDPLSNTGKIVPTYMLGQMNESPETFFSKYIYTDTHDASIKAVADKKVDGASVDSLIWDYLKKTQPELTAKTKIILKSPPYGSPPLVVRPGLSPQIKDKLREVFLNAHLDAEGKELLKRMMMDRFAPGDDKNYDSIREIKEWLEKKGSE
ncbi:MAG: phosphate/phosphite/phosphonate ABC transporter substrate-binding protein [Candidatus Omnitrophica bacterium]|nr:phosphate/phosphite/phosphonate ABC transporter substrate-binding protein [Candidatus Omnitrophota bacterium]